MCERFGFQEYNWRQQTKRRERSFNELFDSIELTQVNASGLNWIFSLINEPSWIKDHIYLSIYSWMYARKNKQTAGALGKVASRVHGVRHSLQRSSSNSSISTLILIYKQEFSSDSWKQNKTKSKFPTGSFWLLLPARVAASISRPFLIPLASLFIGGPILKATWSYCS